MARSQTHFIQSLARGLKVLQAFSAEHPALTLSEVARRSGLNVVAAQRYTDTLMALGFLKRNRHREFFLGPQVLSLGFSFLNGNPLRKVAGSYLQEFSERMQRTVNLAVLDQAEVVFLSRWEVNRFLSYDLHDGSRLPAHCTGTGKCLLASVEDEALRGLLERAELIRVTARSLVEPDKLWDDLMKTRRRGYSIADRELAPDLYSLGAPVINGAGVVEAAVNLSLSPQEVRSRAYKKLLASFLGLGQELSAALGYQGPYPVIPTSDSAGGSS
ncbi:MAG: helix-turn-helix domain-containing protein [Desulfarculaceae bacterium]|nr:helix-turn-helix domain-containing protein [Desulfarculaceae bacterium]MCF8071558.1 helix-turn-helix domain-containing protein [Desulfarculaceae bacterium]MCF8102373.1 helix-turn-helix domain-containing protein [Desulfarculaceae bacterium]MCF8114837.1 helix-turn-helix domain-containing protein [Desulfarculaceae bacterium]